MKLKGTNLLRIDSFTLKVLAIICMVTDHVGALFFPEQVWLRCIGRLAFPIFCFLLVEGFYHTSNLKKYALRLGIFAILSEIPFDLFYSTMLKEYAQRYPERGFGEYTAFSNQNIFFTLFIGLIALYFMDQVLTKWNKNYILSSAMEVLIAVAAGMLAQFLGTDYGLLGIFYIMIFYLYRRQNVFIFFFMGLLTVFLSSGTQICAILAIPLLTCYNGEKGRSMKYFFYAFYPIHLLVLVGIWYLIH